MHKTNYPSPTQMQTKIAQQTGASLIEILISIFVISIGLLGLAALQNASLKLAYNSYQKSQAVFLAYDFIDRARANPGAGAYTISASSNPSQQTCFASDNCTPAQLRAFDLYYWKQQVKELLPEAEVKVEYNASTMLYNMEMSWQDQFKSDPTDPGTPQKFSYSFRIQR